MKKLITVSICLLCTVFAVAQEQLSMKQQADKLFERYEYFNSLKLYLDIPNSKKDAAVKERIAECYRKMNQYAGAEKWYASLLAGPGAPLNVSYNYAQVLQTNQKFEEAKAQYRKFYTHTRNSADLAIKLASCDSAARWLSQKGRFSVSVQGQMNSSFSDWGPAYFGNSSLIFASDSIHDAGKRTYPWNGDGWLKLYTADLQGTITGEFPVQSAGKYHVGPAAFNAALDTAYITITNSGSKNSISIDNSSQIPQRLYTRRLELIMFTKQGTEWKENKSFSYNNPNRYSVGHAALSANGKLLYFTSDMPGGQGKTDLWYCEKLSDGSWAKPVNCGKTINTKEEEAFPVIGDDGTLYFSSKGLPGMGGYDIFSTRGEKGSWTGPQNLKYPINSTSDDFYLSTKDGLSGYFSSNRPGGKGNDDIYSFSKSSMDGDEAWPLIIATTPPKVEATVKTVVPAREPEITADQLIIGKTFVLKNIYYDLNKSDIRPDAAIELDKLLVILNANPGLRIELSAHTDSRASDDYNLELSQRRAEAAVGYLVGKGIDRYRIVAKGYGESRLLNKCANDVECPEEDHQLNRRTEFKVLSNSR